MDFALFILVNATLFIRPAEVVADLEGLPLYEIVILACLVVSLPAVIAQLSTASMIEQPITTCVIGVLVAIVLSHLTHLNFYGARVAGVEFSKVVLYYLLFVGLV